MPPGLAAWGFTRPERPEVEGRINDLTRQRLLVATPTNNSEAATKYSSETFALNVAANQFSVEHANGD
jgi:hypothetical protein